MQAPKRELEGIIFSVCVCSRLFQEGRKLSSVRPICKGYGKTNHLKLLQKLQIGSWTRKKDLR